MSAEYDRLLERARADEDVLGLVLTGSRGRGTFVHEGSDWDVRLVVRDENAAAADERFFTPHGSPVEVAVFPLDAFERAGGIGTPNEWDRYSYVHAQVVVDKLDGRIAALVTEKSVLPPDRCAGVAADALDTYINSHHRASKNARLGLDEAARLDAAESIAPLLGFLFAVHGRVRPFNKFLRWELERFPLGGLMWSAEALLPRLEQVLDGNLGEQQRLFGDVEALARENGHGEVIDSWESNVPFLRGP